MSAINPYYTDSWGNRPFTLPYLETKKSTATKISNFLFPKNELTGHRTFKVIPSFLIHAQGRLNYELSFPFYKISKDPQLNKIVQSVFDRLVTQTQKVYPSTKNMSWKVRIKKDPTVNAFCYPGGKIIITTGFIETLKTRLGKDKDISHEDLIASVLAHEMVHAIAEHHAINKHLALLGAALQKAFIYLVLSLANPVPLLQLALREQFLICLVRVEETINRRFPEKAFQWICKQLEKSLKKALPIVILMKISLYLFLYKMIQLVFAAGYSRLQELEADKYGIFLAKASGYKERAALSVQKMFIALEGRENKPSGWFKRIKRLTHPHPYTQVRLKENEKTILTLKKQKID